MDDQGLALYTFCMQYLVEQGILKSCFPFYKGPQIEDLQIHTEQTLCPAVG